MTGTVSSFDGYVGLGTITSSADGELVPFHCVAIADGSRVIEVGAAVEYSLITKLGRSEAWAIRPR
jgi:cold shock CspA family protein